MGDKVMNKIAKIFLTCVTVLSLGAYADGGDNTLTRPITTGIVRYTAGVPTAIDLTFAASDKCALLYRLVGATDGGTDEAEWDSVEFLSVITSGMTSITAPYPATFTSGVLRYALVEAEFPTEFLDYVYANGAALDTGVYAEALKTCTVVDIQLTTKAKQERLLESRAGSWDNLKAAKAFQYEVYINGSSQGACCCNIASGGSIGTTTAADLNRHTMVLDAKNKIFKWFSTSSITASKFNAAEGKVSDCTISLFNNYVESGGVPNRCHGNLYACSITNDDVCVRDFIPAKIGDRVGMFDLVESKLYESFTDVPFVAGNTITRSLSPTSAMVPCGLTDAITPIDSIPLDISSVSTDDTGAAVFSWELLSLPQGVASADIYIAFGYSADVLPYTNLVANAAVGGDDGAFASSKLQAGRPAFAKIFAIGADDSFIDGNVISFTTPARRDDKPGMGRAITIAGTERTDGYLTAIDLEFGEGRKNADYDLYVAYQNLNLGEDASRWNCAKVGTVTSETNSWHFTDIPAGWGTDAFVIRFFLTSTYESYLYSPDGLFAQWDGKDNVDRGIHGDVQNVSDCAWVDLINGIELSTAGTGVLYNANGVYLPGGAVANGNFISGADPRPLAAAKAKAFTVELALSTGTYSRYGGIFILGTGAGGDRMLFLNEDDGTPKSFFAALQYKRTAWDNEHKTGASLYANSDVTATIVVDQSGASLYLDGTFIHRTVGGSYVTSNTGIILGSYGANATANLTYHSVRMYDRVLSQAEIAAHAQIDAERFYGATPSADHDAVVTSWSPAVYWTDPSSLTIDSVVTDGHYGDKVRFSGMVVVPPTSSIGSVTASIFTGSSINLDDRDETPIPLAQDGTFSIDIPVTPASPIYWTITATDGADETSTPENSVVTTPAGSTLGAASISNSGLGVSVRSSIANVGANTTYVWAELGETSDSLVRATDIITFDRDSTSLYFDLPGTAASVGDIYWRVVCSNDCDSAFWTDATAVAKFDVVDFATYTWKKEVTSGNWEDSANWTTSDPSPFGYPTKGATAIFPAATTAEVSFVSSEIDVGKVDCTADDLKLTFTGGREKTVYTIWFNVSGKRGEICVRDLYVINRNIVSYDSAEGIAVAGTTPGDGRTFRVDNASMENWKTRDYHAIGNNVHIIIENGSYAYTWTSFAVGGPGSTIEFDDSEINIQGSTSEKYGLFTGSSYGGGTIIFSGKNARLRTCGVIRNSSKKSSGTIRFVIPEGGFTYPVMEQTAYNNAYSKAEFGDCAPTETTLVIDQIIFEIDPESPGLNDPNAFTTPLVVWPKGIKLDNVNRDSGIARPRRNSYVFAAESDAPFTWSNTWDSADSPKSIAIKHDRELGTMFYVY